MGRKRVIEQRINKHTKELEESIKLITPKLIEAFVRVYGEEHRTKITNTILNMHYIFFISEVFCDKLSISKKGTRKKYIQIMKSYLKYLNKQDNIFNTVAPQDEEKFIIQKYLSKYPFNVEDYSLFSDTLACDVPSCSAAIYEIKGNCSAEFYICLPIFTIDLKTIIHEINHALNLHIIGYTDEVLLIDALFKKEEAEELVNDFIAEIVLNTYTAMGGIIPKSLKRITIRSEYEYKDYIVYYLFECLIDLLLQSRITGDFNLFYNLVGQDNTNKLENIMTSLYTKDYFDEQLYNELIRLIDRIYERIINSNILNSEEQIKCIENKGFKVRRLKKEG